LFERGYEGLGRQFVLAAVQRYRTEDFAGSATADEKSARDDDRTDQPGRSAVNGSALSSSASGRRRDTCHGTANVLNRRGMIARFLSMQNLDVVRYA